jgi:tRNA threonylcarbamoyladenosine biosynthesis protein TsaE
MPTHAALPFGKRGVLVFRAGIMKKTFSKNDIDQVVRALLAEIAAGREAGDKDRATIVALSGDLGAGKTTLTQAIARELGVVENVISPTFVIMKSYPVNSRRDECSRLVHIDAYRLESSSELERLGWAELIADPANLILIEWPEKVPGAIPTHARRVTLSHKNEEEREIEF